jgi:hypothetical protein
MGESQCFLGDKSLKDDLVFGKGIFYHKISIFIFKNHQIVTMNWFFGDGVATFMCLGYIFNMRATTWLGGSKVAFESP